jgi:hypothetical protein
MSDLIDREEAANAPEKFIKGCNPEYFVGHQKFIEYMDDAEIGSFGQWQFVNGFNMGLTAAEVAIKALPSAQPEPQWIPCSERLPEDGERVLATHLGGVIPDRQVIEHIYANGKFVQGWDMDMNMSSPTFGQRYMGAVIAWMPLPEPYKEDK